MTVVLDTGILIRASAKTTGPARRLLELIVTGKHALVVSPSLLEEVERVSNYPRIQALYRLSALEIRGFLDRIQAAAEVIDPVVSESIVLTDPADDPVVSLAVAARADVICTRDRDFYQPPVLEFCRMRNIRVM